MFSSIASFAHHIRAYPLRGVLTVLTIAVGVAAVVVTASLGLHVTRALERSLEEDGLRIVIANATIGAGGSLDRQLPPVFEDRTLQLLATEYDALHDLTIVSEGRWSRVQAGGTSYQVRSASAVGASYASLMGLDLVAGDFFTASDIASRRRVAVLSGESAAILFGSPDVAIGEQILSAVATVETDPGGSPRGRVRVTQEPFTVVGVYASLSDLERRVYGVGDILIPEGIMVPPGLPIGLDPTSVIMGRLTGDSLDQAEARIRAIVELEYGDDVSLAVWEGSPDGPDPLIAQSRQAVSSFTLTINVLGVVILIASSLGIFSIMLVEVLDQMREIGLRRALGATRADIRRYFLGQALSISLLGSALGVGLAVLFYRQIGGSLAPFFEASGLTAADLSLGLPDPLAVVLAVAAAGIIGSILGLFPAISASRASIVDAIRDDAA